MTLSARQRQELDDIATELAQLARTGPALPGSIAERLTRCGHKNCACHADPPRRHGPYFHWTRKVANKTVGRWLSADQAADYKRWVETDRRLRELLGRLESIGVEALEADPRFER
ncbi:MAG: hypothetical protein M0035_08115 [Actinomycetota bacterium]|jgi:N-acetyl-anhydromuramyl-L-alanine amidase AmpD|nr:hypothetical protein [Actinomycetota bacterium]